RGDRVDDPSAGGGVAEGVLVGSGLDDGFALVVEHDLDAAISIDTGAEIRVTGLDTAVDDRHAYTLASRTAPRPRRRQVVERYGAWSSAVRVRSSHPMCSGRSTPSSPSCTRPRSVDTRWAGSARRSASSAPP